MTHANSYLSQLLVRERSNAVMEPQSSGLPMSACLIEAQPGGDWNDSIEEQEVFPGWVEEASEMGEGVVEGPSSNRVTPVLKRVPQCDPSRQAAVQLVMRMSVGDEEALAGFYELFSPLLYGMALKILHDENEADDVLQETFIQIWKKAACYDSKLSSPSTWAVMIVRNKAIDRLRARNRLESVVTRASEAGAHLPDRDELSAEQPFFREQRRIVREALMGLSAERRIVLELAFFEGLTHEEIARRLGTPLGTVKTRIRRALIEMRNLAGEAR
jgi:RNA polymerase sigma-70 factor, ECF subfamily